MNGGIEKTNGTIIKVTISGTIIKVIRERPYSISTSSSELDLC
jgi:hypothetical protein